jgi:sec-independent protein translocase protein TatC
MIQHLIELRKRLIKSLMSVGIVFLALYPFSSSLFHQFALPLLNQLPYHQELIAITLTGAFFGPIQFCLFCAFFLSAPFILYQLWGFIAPGLYTDEKLFIKILIIASSALFYLGVIFAYYLIFPAVMAFLTHIAPEGVLVTPDISSYLHFSLRLLMAFGLAFEIPVLVVLAVKTNLVSKETLKQKRRYIIVFNFIVGMLLTPDVASQVMLALPMCILFELGLLASSLTLPKQRATENF